MNCLIETHLELDAFELMSVSITCRLGQAKTFSFSQLFFKHFKR